MKNSPIGRSWKAFTLTEILVILIIMGHYRKSLG